MLQWLENWLRLRDSAAVSAFPEAQCGVSSGFSFIYIYIFFYGKDLHEQPKVRVLQLSDANK